MTLVSRLPPGWSDVPLGSLSLHSAFGPRFSSKNYDPNGNVACLRTTDLSDDGKISYLTMPIAKLEGASFENHYLQQGDLVISRSGTCGITAVFDKFPLPVVAGAFLIRFRLADTVLPLFLRYLFNSSMGRAYVLTSATGAVQQNLNITNLEKLRVPLPPLAVQHKIVGILSAYDDLIENNTRRIAILEEMAQAIYREWFVHFRFPGHKNVKLVDSPLGQIPEGWKAVNCSDVLDIKPRTPVPREGEKPFVSMAAVPHNTMLIDETQIEMRTGNNGAKFKNGDTLFARITPCLENGKTAFVQFLDSEDEVAFGSTEFIVLRSKTANPEFVYLLARSDEFRDIAIKSMSGATGRQRVREECFDQFSLAHPPAMLLDQFQEIACPLFRRVFTLAKANVNLRATRDLLLPKLISGKLDVENLDIDVGMNAEELVEAAVNSKARLAAANELKTINNGKAVPPPEAAPQPTPIDELDTDYVMAEFRQEARRLGTVSRAELLKAVSQALGYRRLGTNINEALKGHLRAAIRRKIIAAEGELVCLHTPAMDSYDRDELIEVFKSVMRKNQEYEREDVMRALANYLGFRRLTDTVREPIKSAINGSIRRGLLGYQGELIWRED